MASLVVLIWQGAGTSPTLGYSDFGFSARIDALSVVMMLLVSSVGWVVLRYSRTYLAGEAGQARFMAWMSLTITAVLFLVQAGNLVQFVIAWICTSLFLHNLLLFYPERFQARRAARKKYVTARLADGALLIVAVLLAISYGTGDIAQILFLAKGGDSSVAVMWACGLLAVAALLKSAQFPTHGWLIEVMETPTPVSALLHAGLINAGGFLLIRFADVMLLSPGVLAVLVIVGGFTAIYGSLVMLTQPAVKTSLAWSTIAQMGFMIFQCGLALFPLALLHIVAHSLYKAHAFLSSGSAIENVAAIKRPGPIAPPNGWAVTRAFLVAIGIYVAIGFAFGLDGKSPQSIALGGILIFGVAYLLAQGFADTAPAALMRKMAVYALVASVSYFALQSGAQYLMADVLPQTPPPGPLEWMLIALSLLSFGAIAFAQSLFPVWSSHPAARDVRVHLFNGLYAKAVFDRILGSWSAQRRVTSSGEYPYND
nr:proton-conducting transporter membrane subunit [Sneathiella limimaris]